MLVGGDYTRVLLASALIGAIFLLWADILARTLMAPEDMPIGIVTGLIGCLLYTSPSPRDATLSRMPSSA